MARLAEEEFSDVRDDGGQSLFKTRAFAVAASHPVVEVETVVADAEFPWRVALGRKVLLVGRAAGVADQEPEFDRLSAYRPAVDRGRIVL